jgi:hypothetical protein
LAATLLGGFDSAEAMLRLDSAVVVALSEVLVAESGVMAPEGLDAAELSVRRRLLSLAQPTTAPTTMPVRRKAGPLNRRELNM